jgi:hypothetical protein
MQCIILTIFYMFFSCLSLKTTPKFCINCKFAINNINEDNKFMKCSLFPKPDEIINHVLVTGVIEDTDVLEKDYIYCSTARKFNHRCGKEGKMYKKKYVRKQKP